MALASHACGNEAVLPLLMDRLARFRKTEKVITFLDAVAIVGPDLARAGLLAWGGGRNVNDILDLSEREWVHALPVDLSVTSRVLLRGCVGLKALPSGMRVGDSLDLAGCASLDSLPHDLVVEDDLYLAWDRDTRRETKGLPECPLAALPVKAIRAMTSGIRGQIVKR